MGERSASNSFLSLNLSVAHTLCADPSTLFHSSCSLRECVCVCVCVCISRGGVQLPTSSVVTFPFHLRFYETLLSTYTPSRIHSCVSLSLSSTHVNNLRPILHSSLSSLIVLLSSVPLSLFCLNFSLQLVSFPFHSFCFRFIVRPTPPPPPTLELGLCISQTLLLHLLS